MCMYIYTFHFFRFFGFVFSVSDLMESPLTLFKVGVMDRNALLLKVN